MPGVDPVTAEALRGRGHATVAQLARASTDAVDARLVAAAQQTIVDAFARAGAGTEAALADADARELAERTGMTIEEVLGFQEAAREALGLLLTQRVVLMDGQPVGNVVTTRGERLGVPILTARRGERPDWILAAATGNAIVLVEGDATATARVDGERLEALPLFRLRPDGTERRVRVQEIRERRVNEKGRSLLSRLTGR